MSIFSKLKDMQSFHESGTAASANFSEQFGEPAYSLYTSLDFGSMSAALHNQINVTDENDEVKYTTSTKVVSIKNKTDILDAAGNKVAYMERKPVSLHEKRLIEMADGTKFTLSNELFHLVKDITNIEGLGWQLEGNILGLNFTLKDQFGQPVAAIGQKMLSLHDKYCIDIYQPQFEKEVVTIVIALEKMIKDRENSSSAVDFSGQ
ncbi:MAG: hypothetical protein J6D07_01055 [Mogibacterium sp.]|nr:hypothetical protein [Mogibacterium sp.]